MSVQRSFFKASPGQVEIGRVVFFSKETGFAIVPALHDVQRDPIKFNMGAVGHGAS